MECPKCGLKIDENTLVCPNCKIVLKLVCPICNTINKKNTCNNCGYTIINRCHNCGKINKTIVGKCSKCGFDTNVSAILQDSNIDEFACVTIDFPNLNDMPDILGSTQLFLKFKEKLNGLITNYVKTIGAKRQIIDKNTIIIRFNKDYTYASSAKNAVKSSIELLNLITQMNYKLSKAKDAQLKCNIAILKRNAYATNDDYKSGINIQLLYQNIQTKKLLNSLQMIVDSSIYQVICDEYKLDSIGMAHVKNEYILLYEVDLKNLIHLEPEKEENENLKIPDIIEAQKEIFENEDTIYDVDGITFDEIHCNFTKNITQGLSSEVAQKLMSKRKNIIVIKGKKEYYPRTQEVFDKIKYNNIYNKIIKITCYDDMKYKPYGFFYDLIMGLYGFNTTGKLKEQNNFTQLKKIDESDFIRDMINLKAREFPHPEDIRYGLSDAFETMFSLMRNTLVFIENAEKMDDSSYEIFKILLKKFDQYDVSYLIIADNSFSLHKQNHFLLTKREYTEITLKPTPIKTLIEANANLCKNILETFYMQKIAQNTHGSQMYFMQALILLMDLGILKIVKGSLKQVDTKTVVFPTTLDELIIKRLEFIKKLDLNLFKFFACILLIGPQLDLQSVKFFGKPETDDYLKYLDNKGFIYNSNGIIQVQNYELYYDNILKIMTFEEKRTIANYLVVYFFRENAANPILAKLYALTESSKNEFVQWENLSNINKSLGDFSAYLNCSTRFLKLLDNNINESSVKSIDDYKMEVYENIANLLYKYKPDKIANITQVILDNFERGITDKKVINLCNKILQGCLISGNYTHALLMAHKILSRLENNDINPNNPNFNTTAFMISMIKIEILFNVGDLEDCITLGDELFTIITNNNTAALKPKAITDTQFNNIIVDTAGYIILAKILQLKNDTFKFCELVEKVVKNIPNSFKIMADVDNILHGKPINLNINIQPNPDEKFALFLYNIVDAFGNNNGDANVFASKVYRAKLGAKDNNLNQFELFCDLMIGRSYYNLENYKKAASIYNSVLETSTTHGLKNIKYLAWYSIAELSLKNKDLNTTLGLVTNAIVELEKNQNTNMYILMLFKLLHSKILKIKKEDTEANFCYNQAKQIANKCKIIIK